MLIGSWVMPLYGEFFGISYVLRTMDVDFAVQLLKGKSAPKADLPAILAEHGFTSFLTQSGLQKFSRDGFTIEFITERKGNRDETPIPVRNWNVNAVALPFVGILTSFPFIAQFPGYKVRAPLPEAFFLHKLITATRRREASKKSKDLEQCSAIAPRLDQARLESICRAVKLGSATRAAIRLSCETIRFAPQRLGLA